MPEWTVVDLGCKKGGALDVYRKHGHTMYKFPEAPRSKCLGIDLKERYQPEMAKRRYEFRKANVLTDFDFPAADVYLAFDFLEHLPSIADSQQVLRRMIDAAAVGVWLRCPSFEDEPQLTTVGLRFAWTRWKGHPSHFKLADATAVTSTYDAVTVRIKPNEKIVSAADRRIVPEYAPEDTVKYSSELGTKPDCSFNPPLVGQYEIFIRKET